MALPTPWGVTAGRVAVLAPLTLCAIVYTAQVTAPDLPDGPVVSGQRAEIRPVTAGEDDTLDPAEVPDRKVEAPASVSGKIVARGGSRRSLARTAEIADIPVEALVAYQRAEVVINHADPTCRISWPLLAGIGRVESDHGRHGGSSLDDDGVATPPILGLRLDGRPGTSRIRDTDAGLLDGDTSFDRAVGPMQFIPSTWAIVGVDADGDGERNPQDMDDAALGAAVYLCAGDDDLSTRAGQRASVFRYNHSQSYVDLVLSLADAYADGESASASAPGSTPSYDVPPSRPGGGADQGGHRGRSGKGDGPRRPRGPHGKDQDGPRTPHDKPDPPDHPRIEGRPHRIDPSQVPTPSPSPTVTPTPEPSPSATPDPTPAPSPTAEPSPSASPAPSASPTPTAEPSPSTEPSPSAAPDPSAAPQPSAAPGAPDKGDQPDQPAPGDEPRRSHVQKPGPGDPPLTEEEADLYCRLDEGLVDNVDSTTDPYDVCVAELVV